NNQRRVDMFRFAGHLFGVRPVEITYCDQKTRMLGLAAAAAQTLRQLLDAGCEGDALVFMPGAYEIRKTIEACSALHLREKILLLPLYGSLSPDEQHRVMEPAGCRKVIVATNIAETSLTIPGVRHVIDSGLAKVSRYDPVRGVDMLNTENIARDSAEQRAGRAGRVAPGTCHRLWTWLEQSARPPRTAPEIQRVDLAEAVLAVSAFGYKEPAAFPWFERPPERPLALAQALLEMLGFVQQGGGLTSLGKELANFPAHPRISLLMRLGAESGCFRLTAWASALLSERPLIAGGASSRSDNTERRQRARRNARAGGLPASDFLECFALLHAAREAHFAKDACDSLGVSAVAARDICRSAEDYCAQGTRIGWDRKHDANPEMRFLQCLLRAFPDRLARRKDTATLACELQNGRHAELARESVVREEPFFVAAELRETGSAAKLSLSLASGITEEWLLDFFPDQWTETDETYWDERRQQVLRRQTLSCLGLLLEEKVRSDPDPEQAAGILAKLLIEGKAPVPNWDDEVERFIARVRWTAGLFPEQGLPLYDEECRRRILRNLCLGETSLKRMKDNETLSFVKGLLTHSQLRFLDEVAPPHVQLPTGRRMRIEYAPGQQPKGKAKIQDLYDLPRIPELAHGRAHVLLDILAPNMRTVQITDDLAGFWANLYPKIRTELSRRYPRHKWR
ncbi:MAG: hypothetical protein IJJ33_02250, partial [Victivallales bacterium]|nr:hypothetical protein [Victivallales bacterium]